MRNAFTVGLASVLVYFCSSQVFGQDDVPSEWPKEITVPQGKVIIYQPQPDSLDGNKLEARTAVAVEEDGSEGPVFGAVWFTARLNTDRSERTATLEDISVTRTRFPERDEDKAEKLKNLLEEEMPQWEIVISMDRLLATMDVRDEQIRAASQISTEAPIIIFAAEPAVLITLDGEARLSKEEGSDLMRVVNTPFTVLLDSKSKIYYLAADADTWYTASDLAGDWTVATTVPQNVAALAPEANELEPEDIEEDEGFEPGPPPKVFVATEPTELISSSGEPEYTPISGTDLLYMSSTDSDVFLHLTNQQHYVLLAGRWYAANSLDGPWRYVPGDELPEDFAQIPEDNQMGTVLYAVPGTSLAEEAVLDAQIPQTATIERKETKLDVEYDGDPEFEQIAETKMTYAVNTGTPVISAENKYYAVDEAVWFVSNSASGPWVVATEVPQLIYTIPATSPIYHVTYVHIYDSTPEVVYVGYLPGYTGTYVYNTTIVYGTGYYYPGWYGTRYYPRHSNWGFHVRYNPWGGWNFGLSYSTGPFTFYIGGRRWNRGLFGPGRYRGYRHGYRRGARRGSRAGYRAGYRAGRRNSSSQNMYNSQRNQARAAPQSQARNQARSPSTSNRSNNVYADRNGNVQRQNSQGGWEQRTQSGWQGSNGQQQSAQQSQRSASQPSSRPSSSGNNASRNQQQLNRSASNRQRGNQRANSYNRSRGSSGRSGGRRRR